MRSFRALLEFYHIARQDVITEDDLEKMQDAISRFHSFREVFAPIRPNGFSLPRQHSIVHYPALIRLFAAANGLCSSITESKHIRAVKEPWRWSNRNNALFQMLTTNQRLDQLAAARVDFSEQGMLNGTLLENILVANGTYCTSSYLQSLNPFLELPFSEIHEPEQLSFAIEAEASIPDEDAIDAIDDSVLAEVKLSQSSRRSTFSHNSLVQWLIIFSGLKWNMTTACQKLELPEFPQLLRRFLYDQLYRDSNANVSSSSYDVSIDACPVFEGKISIFGCALATFQAPSDPSGPRGMRRKFIRATAAWQNSQSRYDCIFINSQTDLPGMGGLGVARVFLFFSFVHEGVNYPCALIQWFSTIGDEIDDETGLWMMEPEVYEDSQPHLAIIHLDSVIRAAHLVPAYDSSDFIRRSLTMHDTLDEFKVFYVNKFVDHHAFKLLS